MADGAVGDQDRLKAIETTLAQRAFDEIILSTLPPGMSRWLAWDLPHRVRRRTNVPLTVITTPSSAQANDPVHRTQKMRLELVHFQPYVFVQSERSLHARHASVPRSRTVS